MKRNALWIVLMVVAMVGISNCGSGSSTTPPPPPVVIVSITQAPGAIGNNSTTQLIGTVNTSGGSVTWSCAPAGSCGSFSPAQTASGVATTYTAPGVATDVTITATSGTTSASADISVTANYAFYLSGLETGTNFYAVAGSVTLDADGNVFGGETDYNDADGITSPTGGDAITGGTLSVDGTGEGTLSLITSNPSVGVAGTETLGIQFVNSNHALIVQFDGTATSSGSLDFQTLPITLSGSFSFDISGVTPGFVLNRRAISNSVVAGGVFTTSDGINVTDGKVDVNDGGTLTHGAAFTGTLTGPDALGRGTLTSSYTADSFSFYVVGPEVIRIIDVDAGDSAVGSAYGQGESSGVFDVTALTTSVFEAESNPLGFNYAVAGMIIPYHGAATLTGVADVDEEGLVASGSAISGSYEIAANGYGQFTITNGGAEDVTTFGMYMTDPNLNLLDPNNTSSGLGGALLVDIDTNVNGTGVLIPQTDTVSGDFAGNYAFGAQLFDAGDPTVGWEVDFVGNGTVTAGALSGTALVSDPFFTLSDTGENTGATVTGTATPDGVNAGRYTMDDFTATLSSPAFNVPVVVYQASGDQALWIDEGPYSTFAGSLQQEPQVNAGVVKKTLAKKKPAR